MPTEKAIKEILIKEYATSYGDISYSIKEQCPKCKGKGTYYYDNIHSMYEDPGDKECFICKGSGEVQIKTRVTHTLEYIPYDKNNTNYP